MKRIQSAEIRTNLCLPCVYLRFDCSARTVGGGGVQPACLVLQPAAPDVEASIHVQFRHRLSLEAPGGLLDIREMGVLVRAACTPSWRKGAVRSLLLLCAGEQVVERNGGGFRGSRSRIDEVETLWWRSFACVPFFAWPSKANPGSLLGLQQGKRNPPRRIMFEAWPQWVNMVNPQNNKLAVSLPLASGLHKYTLGRWEPAKSPASRRTC